MCGACGPAAVRATTLRSAVRLTPAIIGDLWRAARRGEPRYVPLVGKPGEAGAMTSPDADPAVDRLAADSGLKRGDFPETIANGSQYIVTPDPWVNGTRNVAPFDQPFYLVMNIAVGGKFLGKPDKATAFPAEMVVDYVRVYEKVGGYGQATPRAEGKLPFGK